MHSEFEPAGLVITLAYYPDGRQEALLASLGAAQYVAGMHAMSYDQQGKHSTWEYAVKVRLGALPYGALGVTFSRAAAA